jgi:predicted transporter
MVAEVKEIDMPPLTTPISAIPFMVMFFVLMMGIPLFVARHHHHHTWK